MDLRYTREATVGAIVLVAIVVFVFGTMWLSGRSVNSANTVRIQFDNVSGLKRASPVRVSGVNVGKVEKIEFMDVGKVLVVASLPPKIRPRVDASAKIVSVTLVGDYAVDFDPGRASEFLPMGRVILGTQDLGLTGRAAVLAERVDSMLLGAQGIVNERTAAQLRSTLTALEAPSRRPSAPCDLPDTATAPAEITRPCPRFASSARLDSTLASPRFPADRSITATVADIQSFDGSRTRTLLAG